LYGEYDNPNPLLSEDKDEEDDAAAELVLAGAAELLSTGVEAAGATYATEELEETEELATSAFCTATETEATELVGAGAGVDAGVAEATGASVG
jgi:hypothetical protein